MEFTIPGIANIPAINVNRDYFKNSFFSFSEGRSLDWWNKGGTRLI